MVRRGQLTPEQAAVHPHRSIITRALGTEDAVEPDVFEILLDSGRPGAVLQRRSERHGPEDEIGRLLGQGDDPQAIADSLVGAALQNGGEDNVTVVVVIVVGSRRPRVEVPPDDATMEFGPARSRRCERRAGPTRMPAPAAVGRGSRGGSGAGGCGGVVGSLLLAADRGRLRGVQLHRVLRRHQRRQVALFRGMPAAPLGVELYSAVEVSPTRYERPRPAYGRVMPTSCSPRRKDSDSSQPAAASTGGAAADEADPIRSARSGRDAGHERERAQSGAGASAPGDVGDHHRLRPGVYPAVGDSRVDLVSLRRLSSWDCSAWCTWPPVSPSPGPTRTCCP